MSAIDQGILDFFIHHRVEVLNPVVVVFTILTGPTLVWIYSLITAVVMRTAFPPLAVGAANLLSHVLKRVIERPRPDVSIHLVVETKYSMPSGHAVGAAAFAIAMTLLIRQWWVLILWLVALLIGVSRLYVGVHWPSDLLVGWVVGVVTVLVVHRVYVGVTSWSRRQRRRSHC
ncbi:PAP2 family protein [Corynebacterium efficiens YS-314]|nr:phosphatase PAP2 family protein [Corynebacterium efficiens]EEW51254.1 PAP2 family protein [Corynebacterium efficiens YS-314]